MYYVVAIVVTRRGI